MSPSPLRRALSVLVCLLAFFLSPLDFSVLEPALPSIQQEFGVSAVNITWTYTLYALSMMLGAPLIAKLADSRGRRIAFSLTMLIFGLGTSVAALAPSYAVFLAGRALQGLGAGGIAPVAAVIIADLVARRWRATVLSLMGVVVGIGLLIGPLIGDLALRLGWQTIFFVLAPPMFVLGALGYFLLFPGKRLDQPFDLRGLIVLGLTVSSFLYGLVQINPNNFIGSLFSLDVLPYLVAAAVLLFLLVRIETGATDPLIKVTMFQYRQVVLASSLAIGYGFTRTALAFLPELAESALGEPIGDTVLLVLPLASAIVVASLAAGVLTDRIGTRTVVITGMVLLSLGILLFGLYPTNQTVFVVAGVFSGIGAAVLVGAPVRVMFLNEFPEDERSAGQGLFAIMWTLGQEVSGVLLGSLLAARGGGLNGYTTAYLAIGVVFAALTVAAFGLKNRTAEQAAARP